MAPNPDTTDFSSYTPIVNQKKQLVSKWNLIFSNNSGSAWISFKPQLGLHVYPCYACRDLFASKTTFQDHTNRRAILIKYDCKDCDQTLTFYNRCSLLMHARTHFTLLEGRIDLGQIEIFSLPFGMMGFLPHPGVTKLYDADEELVDENDFINAQFYSPDISEKGKQIICLKPNDLLFCGGSDELNQCQLTLRQKSVNIPLCQFITVEHQKRLRQNQVPEENVAIVKEEIPESPEPPSEPTPPVITFGHQVQMPVISKIESLSKEQFSSTYPRCPECKETQRCSMKMHFVGKNVPFDENLRCSVCKYVASTKCSFSAHQRIHANVAPFTCPECGKKFEGKDDLMNHLDDVCFHLAKQVRIRCPGKKCGKLFASAATFSAHFAQHIQVWLQCTVCKECFESMIAFSEHARIHSNLCFSDKIFKCLGCKVEESIIFPDNVRQHIQYHSLDRSRCMYVFICKFCKNYFRSTLTYATHLLKCQKMQALKKQGFSFNVSSCIQCQNKIIFYENDVSTACSKCRYLNFKKNIESSKQTSPADDEIEVNVCVLCKDEIPDNKVKTHPFECVYRNPKIFVKKLNDCQMTQIISTNSNTMNSNETSGFSDGKNSPESTESENSKSPNKAVSPKSNDNGKRKRKKAPLAFRGKKLMSTNLNEESDDLQAEEPTPFDGTYRCKLCCLQESDRETFHKHIINHRDISTAYQCMECGECFVVKPSLIKHLMHYHKIDDTNSYLESNDCYDKSAVEELKEIMKLAPGESRGPVKDNQCRVCLEQFLDAQELSKHFRIHGMAFLMKNTRE